MYNIEHLPDFNAFKAELESVLTSTFTSVSFGTPKRQRDEFGWFTRFSVVLHPYGLIITYCVDSDTFYINSTCARQAGSLINLVVLQTICAAISNQVIASKLTTGE